MKKNNESLDKYASNWVCRKTKFNWTFFAIGIVSFIPTVLLMMIFAIDPTFLISHSWINWVMLFGFGSVIVWALFAAQRRKLVGAYGESILLLIPTFVWLLPGHIRSIEHLLYFATALMVIGGTIYFIAVFMRFFINKKNKIKFRNIAPVLMRFGFVFSTVVSTLIISILLINFASYSTTLAGKTNHWDFSSEPYITFISVIAIVIALMIIILELLTVLRKKVIKAREETILINTKKLDKKANKQMKKEIHREVLKEVKKVEETRRIKVSGKKKK